METALESNTNGTSAQPRRKTYALYLDPALVAEIDKFAKQSELTRSWVISQVLRGWLDDQRDGF